MSFGKKLLSLFYEKPKDQPIPIENILSDEKVLNHPTNIAGGYRTRTGTFNGEKYSGGMNYPTAHGIDRQTMVQRSIKAYNESTQASAAINRLNECAINTGLSLESTPVISILGISTEERKEISNKIEARWNLWSSSKGCDVSANNTLGQIERICFNNQLVKGDYFVQITYSKNPNLINPLQIKIVAPHRVSNPQGDAKEKALKLGNRIIEGIEIDGNDMEIAYHIKSKNIKTGQNEWIRIPRVSPKTGQVLMIHGNRQRFGTEVRGIPALANIAHELEKVTDYSILELQAAVTNATIALYVKPGENAPASNFMPSGTFVPPSLQQGSTLNEPVDHGYTNIGKNVLENAGGLNVSTLGAGEDLSSYDTKRPNVNFAAFVDAITKHLSASLSIPVEVLNMVFGNNFSASRASLKLFWQSLAVWRDEFVSDFMTPIYNAWLLGEVGTGRLILRGYDDPQLRAAWQSASWIGIPSPSIDPVKEAKGATIRINEGLSTREQEQQKMGNLSGYDSTISRLTDENKLLAVANEPLQEQETAAA